MQRKRHTEEQVIAILKEHEAGMILKEHEAGIKTADLCRKYGISEASFYNWKAKYGGPTSLEEIRRNQTAAINLACGLASEYLTSIRGDGSSAQLYHRPPDRSGG